MTEKKELYLYAISLLVLMLFFCCTQREQNDFSDLKGAYLGQRLPGMTPEVFAPGILSHGLHEHALTISPNGSELFYVTTDSSFSYYTIIRVVKENNHWKEPEVAPFSGEYLDLAPSFSPDGTKLFYSSSRPVPGSHKEKSDLDIWVVEKQGDSWSSQKHLPAPLLTEDYELNASAASNGNLYFQRGSVGDIFVANFQDGCYLAPERLPLPVNSEHDESAPFISPDESFLLFHSNRPGGFGGMDIYICFRKKSGQWSPPVNLGEPVNTAFNEGGPCLSPDRKYLFFSRFAILGPDNFKGKTYKELMKLFWNPQNTFYWVDARILGTLHPDFLEDIE